MTTVTDLAAPPRLARVFAEAVVTARLAKPRDLPDVAYRLSGQRVDRSHLLAYQRICGFPVNDLLPATYPHVLGFPLQARLMGRRDFPFPLPGLLHTTQQVTAHRALTAHDILTVAVHAERLRSHPRGRLVDLVTEVTSEGEVVWEGRSTYLHRGTGDATAERGERGPAVPEGPPAAIWRVPRNIGRRYARVSGDVNPIHLHPLTARAMGLPTTIAHGMWSGGRLLAGLGHAAYEPSVARLWFRKPLVIPGTVEVTYATSGPVRIAGVRSRTDPPTEIVALSLSPLPA